MASARKSPQTERTGTPGHAPQTDPCGGSGLGWLITEQDYEDPADENQASEDKDDFDDEDSCFTTESLDGGDLDDVSEASGERAGQEQPSQLSDDGTKYKDSDTRSAPEQPAPRDEGSKTSSARNQLGEADIELGGYDTRTAPNPPGQAGSEGSYTRAVEANPSDQAMGDDDG